MTPFLPGGQQAAEGHSEVTKTVVEHIHAVTDLN